MTKWTVVWEESAEIMLGNVWLATGRSPKITVASYQIDKLLNESPLQEGKPLSEGL